MKKIIIGIVLIFWIIFTLLLAISIIGIVVLRREDHNCVNYQGVIGESAWMKLGNNLMLELIK